MKVPSPRAALQGKIPPSPQAPGARECISRAFSPPGIQPVSYSRMSPRRSASKKRRAFSPNSEFSERDYFHAEARGSRRDFWKLPNPRALHFSPFSHSAGTSVFRFSHFKKSPPRSPRLRVKSDFLPPSLSRAPRPLPAKAQRHRARPQTAGCGNAPGNPARNPPQTRPRYRTRHGGLRVRRRVA